MIEAAHVSAQKVKITMQTGDHTVVAIEPSEIFIQKNDPRVDSLETLFFLAPIISENKSRCYTTRPQNRHAFQKGHETGLRRHRIGMPSSKKL